MLGGVAALIARLGMRREVALYCELNAPLMSRRYRVKLTTFKENMACVVRALLESVAVSWLDRASRAGSL